MAHKKPTLSIKICGVKTADIAHAVGEAGATHIGLVFHPPSPRALDAKGAEALAPEIPDNLIRVGVFVDPDDATLGAMIDAADLNMVQLHGSESPDRVTAIKKLFNLPVIKAIAVSGADNIERAKSFEGVADLLLFDAKTPKSALPGGMGLRFDWSLLAGHSPDTPWGLSGGLTPENVAEAIEISGASFVDVSSGVETAPGIKDKAKISAFMAAIREKGA